MISVYFTYNSYLWEQYIYWCVFSVYESRAIEQDFYEFSKFKKAVFIFNIHILSDLFIFSWLLIIDQSQ